MSQGRTSPGEGREPHVVATGIVVPLLRHVTDGAVILYAAWTLLAHLAVWSGTGFDRLVRLSPLAVAAVLLWFTPVQRSVPVSETRSRVPADAVADRACLAGCVAALFLTLLFSRAGWLPYAWLGAVLLLLAARFRPKAASLCDTPPGNAGPPSWADLSLLGGALAMALLAVLFVSRPDADDSLYLNMSVSVLDAPDRPIFASDTLHGIGGGNYIPTYRVHSYELMIALLARITGLSPITVAHGWLPLVGAVLSVLALARLFRTLLPDSWARATLVCVGLLLAIRDTHVIYGNFAYVRLFQGKSWFVLIMVPLITACALEFFHSPGRRPWLLLASAQVAAVGFTANALYAAPLTAAFSLLACARSARASVRRLLAGLTASAYPVLMGLLVAAVATNAGLATARLGQPSPVEASTSYYLGRTGAAWLWFFCLTGAWCLVRSAWLKRWLLGYSLLFIAFCVSPFWDDLLMRYVTGNHLIWRLFWVIPLPAITSIAICDSARRFQKARCLLDRLPGLLMLGLILVSLPAVMRPEGPTWITKTPFEPKVPEKQYRHASAIVQMSRPGDVVLAPEPVSTWIPTFRGHPRPLVSRKLYVEGLRVVFADQVDTQDLRERLALSDYVSGAVRTEDTPRLFVRALKRYPLRRVAVYPDNPWSEEIGSLLDEAGYRLEDRGGIRVFSSPEGRRPDIGRLSPSGDASGADTALFGDARAAVTRLCDNQQPAGYWLTAHTASTHFDKPRVEVNTFLPALLIDVLGHVNVDTRLEGALRRARAYLAGQIESDGLVRYRGRPDPPGASMPRNLISPDSDCTSLAWRITGGRRELLPRVLSTLAAYRTEEGLYRTWLAPREAFVGIDPGSDPNPPDVAIQMHLLMFLATADPPAARALYAAFRDAAAQDRLWVYYKKAPLVPILRQADLIEAGFPLTLPESLQQTTVPGQQPWVTACRWISRFRTGVGPKPSSKELHTLLDALAKDDFAVVRTSPPLMYHNDLTARIPRFYWSEDLGYALWLRLYVAALDSPSD